MGIDAYRGDDIPPPPAYESQCTGCPKQEMWEEAIEDASRRGHDFRLADILARENNPVAQCCSRHGVPAAQLQKNALA